MRPWQLATRVLVACAAGVPLLLLASAGDADRLPLLAPIALLAFLFLSFARPADALVLTAAVVPLSEWITRTTQLDPFRLAEAIVLTALSGIIVRHAFVGGWDDAEASDGTTAAQTTRLCAALLISVAMASVLVQLGLSRVGIDARTPFAAELLGQLATHYLYGTRVVVPGMLDAARLIEGAVLVLLLGVWCRRQEGLSMRLAIASLVGAAAAALINLVTLAARVVVDENPVGQFLSYLAGRALAVHVTDINAAGSYFLMATLLGIGVSLSCRSRYRYLLWSCTLLSATAFWLAGSRAALGAAVLATFVAGALWVARRPTSRARLTALLGIGVAGLVALPLAMIAAYPERTAAADSVGIRAEFTSASLRMWETRPVFGVGAGRYYDLSSQFMSPALRSVYPRENAHNNYLQIAAELGLVGLGAFAAFLGVMGHRVWRALRAGGARDPLLIAGSGGAAVFLVTCLTGHPLLVNETAYPFWIVCGLVIARAQGHLGATSASPSGSRKAAATWALCAGLLVSVPFRVDGEVRGVTLEEMSSGLYGWETERPSGRRFRWSGPRATIFAPTDARRVLIPLRALHASADEAVDVNISVGGRQLIRVPLLTSGWVEVPVDFAEGDGSRWPHRIDVAVDPTWSTRGGRPLGVKVGDLLFAGLPRE